MFGKSIRLWTGAALLAFALAMSADALAEKSILRLRLDGPVLESPGDGAGLLALLEGRRVNTLHEWVKMLQQGAADKHVAGLALIIETPEVNLAQVGELTQAVQAFRDKGKPVYAYLDYGDNLSYALAASADHITLAENSELGITGLHTELSYYKGLLDKIGVETQMLHCGAYKSAIEPYSRTEPSPEAAENMNWLLDGMFARWVELIADGRKLSVDEVKQLVDRAPLSAEQALAGKLIDEVSSFGAFKQRIYKQFGDDVEVLKKYEEQTATEIDPQDPFAFFQFLTQMFEHAAEPAEPGVGLIFVEGAIMVGPSDDSPFGTLAGSTTIRAALEEARADDSVRAVVLRIDSPGGSAIASDIIWQAASRCAAAKPLIVSMGRVAASGGYYVAMPAATIFADAGTLTGSIGVAGGKIVWSGLMEEKLGITTTEFSRGQHAGLFSLNRAWSPAERDWVTQYMEQTYAQFKGRVQSARGERLQKDIEELAGGRVYTGQQALELGLIDRLGSLSDALELAASKGGLSADYSVKVLPEPSGMGEVFALLGKLMGEDDSDEFEIQLAASLRHDSALRVAAPLARELAPAQLQDLLRGLYNLVILQREHVGCFAAPLPRVH